jgi:hypothetical protein
MDTLPNIVQPMRKAIEIQTMGLERYEEVKNNPDKFSKKSDG